MTRQPQEATTTEKTLPRLNRFLAEAGFGSRRHVEQLVREGRVTINREVVTELGLRVDPETRRICVDGQHVRPQKKVYYLVNKPRGYVCTSAEMPGQPRVIDLLTNVPQRVYTVGRLDKSSDGLMLVTNDGDLAQRLAHPRFGVEKTYLAQVLGKLSRRDLEKLREGIWLSIGKVRPAQVRIQKVKGQSTVLRIVLTEGKNREIRRMLARLGHKVLNLRRITLGPLHLAGLGVGHSRKLTATELDLLRGATPTRLMRRSPRRRKLTARPRTQADALGVGASAAQKPPSRRKGPKKPAPRQGRIIT